MSLIITKKEILSELLALAQSKEKIAKENQKKTQERASEEEGAMQSRYSTFKEEGQYLAGGLKIIHEDLKADVAMIQSMIHYVLKENEKVESLSIVEVEFEDGSQEKFFIIPAAGGEKIREYKILSPKAPLGKALIGKEIGDRFAFRIGDNVKKGEILDVA